MNSFQKKFNLLVLWTTAHFKYCTFVVLSLKERLPQAFMQIGWMENNFRNSISKGFGQIWTIQSRSMIIMIFQRWHSATLCDVTTVQLSNETVHAQKKKITYHENVYFPYFLYLGMLGPIMTLHAFMMNLLILLRLILFDILFLSSV